MNSEEFAGRLKASLLDEPADPLFESLKPVLKFTMGQPTMRRFVAMIEEAQGRTLPKDPGHGR